MSSKTLSPTAARAFLDTLEARFKAHPHRHDGLDWEPIRARLEAGPGVLWSLSELERTGGEPDVAARESGQYLFFDCSAQSPAGRRSLCYDREALEARKKFKPEGSAVDLATEMGGVLLSEAQYRHLQTLGEFDTKTSSWLLTPPEIRALGGAVFGDRRYDTVFLYHNGADSYYAARGFRCVVRV